MSAEAATQELAVIEHEPRPLAQVQVAPQVQAAELVARLNVIREAMVKAMQPDVDYGVIPGTGSKPTLLKPGAEKLGALFQLDVQLENEKTWHDDGHLTVVSKATVFHQPTGTRLGSGEGICSTREAKYAYRNAERVCPSCGKPAIIKGKQEYGGGWVCFKRKDGCGAKFLDDEPAITKQPSGKVENEALADTYNTVDKMASKRARIDAVLAVTGASALFTQDVEDLPQFEAAETQPAQAPAAAAQAQAAQPPAQPANGALASEKQQSYLAKLIADAGVTGYDVATLTKSEASHLIEQLKSGALPPPRDGDFLGAPDDSDGIPFLPSIDGLGG